MYDKDKLINMNQPNGFVLPLVLVVSLATLFILTPLIAKFVTSLDISHASYQARVAKESARAGLAYATACYNESEGDQTWGSAAVGGARPNLTPSTSCTGATISGQSNYLFNDGNVRTSFNVGNITSSDDFGIEIAAQGTADRLGLGGTSFLSYSSQLKRVSWGDDKLFEAPEVQIDQGTSHTCVLLNGEVWCWGTNGNGELGIGSSSPSSSSTPLKVLQAPGVMAGEKIVKISIEGSTSCAISESGKLFCWGVSVGSSSGSYSNYSPYRVTTGGLQNLNVTDVSVAHLNLCLIANGKVYCMGADVTGSHGNGSGSGLVFAGWASGYLTLTPTLVTTTYLGSGYNAVSLARTGHLSTSMCAILDTGQMYCWGGNIDSQLGLNIGMYWFGYWQTNYPGVSVPRPIYDTASGTNNGYLDGNGVLAVSTAGTGDFWSPHNVSCAISNGDPYCTRARSVTHRNGPFEKVNGSYTKPVFDITVGNSAYPACLLAQDGLYCWDADGSSTLTKIATVSGKSTTEMLSIQAHNNNICGIFSDGHAYCWTGISGSGTLTNVTEITQIYNLVSGAYF